MDPDSDTNPLSISTLLLANISLPELGIGILIIVVLLFCTALIAASEVAFFSITPDKLTENDSELTPPVQRIMRIIKEPQYLLSTLLVSISFLSVGTVVVSSFVLETAYENFEYWLHQVSESETVAKYGRYSVEIGLVTFMLVLFGEVIPKVYASTNSMPLAKLMSAPITFLMRVFHPINWVLVQTTSIIEKRFEKNNSGGAVVSMEDFDSAIDLAVADRNVTTEREVDILKGILKFGQISVTQIMTSRVDMVVIDKAATFMEVLAHAREWGFSRIPVYEESPDHITGVLHTKDLLAHLHAKEDFAWQTVIRPVYFVPEMKKIDDLLREFQLKRMHLAIVVDEFGGTLGMATFEDIMEEIVGDIRDEFDEPEDIDFQKIDDKNYIFKGKLLLNDICRVLDLDLDFFDGGKGEADTLGGFILELNDTFPIVNTVLTYENLTLTVTAVGKRRVEEVKITIA